MLARVRQLAGPDLVLIGVGGVDSAAAAWSKIAAGADLVQLYTGLVYEGPTLPTRIAAGLLKRLDERGIGHIQRRAGDRDRPMGGGLRAGAPSRSCGMSDRPCCRPSARAFAS